MKIGVYTLWIITFIVLLFVNPLKLENRSVCTNLPFLDGKCLGYSSKGLVDHE